MNERIKKLAEQAGATVITTHGMEYVVDGCYVIGPARLEKFAELIVQECLDIVNRKEYSYHEADPLWETSQLIKEHFGVRS